MCVYMWGCGVCVGVYKGVWGVCGWVGLCVSLICLYLSVGNLHSDRYTADF